MNLTELSISRAGRSSTRTEGACLVSSLKIARRGPQGRGTAPKNQSCTVPVTPEALRIQSWTVSVTPEALRIQSWTVSVTPEALKIQSWRVPVTPEASRTPFSTPVLNGDAPQDGFSWHPVNTNPMLNENRNLGLGNTLG